jgi:hypothetical protein
MTDNGETSDKNSAAGKSGKHGKGSSKSSSAGKIWTAIGIPVVVILLGSWLTPLPHEIAKIFHGHHDSPAADSAPLTVAVRKYVGPCGQGWIVRKPAGDVPKPPSSESLPAWESWISKTRAIDVSYTDVIATIQARPGQVVYITGFRFNVISRKPPAHGTMVTLSCGGAILGRYVAADLDTSPPRIIATSSNPASTVGGISAKPLKLPYEVTYSDGLVLNLYAQAKKYDCTWSADISWSSGGKTGDYIISDGGAPFETSPYLSNLKVILGGE